MKVKNKTNKIKERQVTNTKMPCTCLHCSMFIYRLDACLIFVLSHIT